MESVIQCRKYEVWNAKLSHPDFEGACVVIQNNTGNRHSPTTIVVPIVSEIQEFDLYIPIDFDNRTKFILMSSVRTIDKTMFISNEPIEFITNIELRNQIQKLYFAIPGLKKVYKDKTIVFTKMTDDEIQEMYYGEHKTYTLH